MFRNYLTIALRNIIRHKLYSFINIAGLAVGLACVIFDDPVRPRRAVLRQVDSRQRESLSGRGHLLMLRARPAIAAGRRSAMPLPVAMRNKIPEVTRHDPISASRIR